MSQITNVNSAYSKSLGAYPETNTPTNSKTLGGLDAPTDYNGDGNIDDLENYAHQLKSWLIQNYTNPQVDWATLNQYIQYCDTNLGSSIMGELGLSPMGMGGAVGPQGGTTGPANTKVYDSKVVDATASGYPMTYDIFGEEININVPFHSAKVTIEKTTDTRLNPPEEVIKVIVRSGIPETEEVFFIHNTDAKIKINAANQNQVTNNTNGLDIEIGEYVEGSEGGSFSESSVKGEVQEDGSILYDGTGTGTIELTPQASGVDGEETIHDVEGDADLIFKNTDEVSVEEVKDKEHNFEVTVLHKDGSKDVYYIHKEYTFNFTGEPSHILFNGVAPIVAPTKDGEDIVFIVPPFDSVFTVNELETKELSLNFNFVQQSNAETTQGPDPQETTKFVDDLAGVTQKGEGEAEVAEVLNTLFEVYYESLWQYDADENGQLSREELAKAVEEGAFQFPPAQPDTKLFELLYKLDPTLKDALDEINYKIKHNDILPYDEKPSDAQYKAVRDRLVQLLQTVYGVQGIKASEPGSGNSTDGDIDNLWFQGAEYDVVSDGTYKEQNIWELLALIPKQG